MSVPFAINGLGRVGRALLRIAHRRGDLEVAAVNDVVPAAALARLLARDTVHGPFPGEVAADGAELVVDGRRIPVSAAPRPAGCPWGEASPPPRVVVEATGRFLARADAAGHFGSPAVERVVLSANSADADVTLCLGVNDGDYDPARHRVISNASCTTNCMAPLLAVLDARYGVERALMSTVHSYTGNQRLLDAPHPEARRARAAAANVIPVGTTAPAALGRVLPALAGRVEGVSVRVPTPMGAMMELAVDLGRDADAEALRDAFREAAAGERQRGVLAVCEEELVSSDFVGSPFSAVVDLPLVAVAGRRLARVVAWYDNEWGYASRLADLIARL
jgi:glyceraldehyde 3-phosphate dehydrogenase